MKKIVAFGDSIMKGIITAPIQQANGRLKYCVTEHNFANECARIWGMALENYAKFGSTVRHAQKVMDRYLYRVEPGDIVPLEYGGNECDFDWAAISHTPDASHSPQIPLPEFAKEYDSIIDRVETVGGIPILLSRPPVISSLFFNNISRNLDAGNILQWLGGDCNWVTNWQEMYNLEIFKIGERRGLQVVDISSAFLANKWQKQLMCEDGMHPNELGHQLIASTVLKQFS